jgi:tetratricopeptide (TPR) repeat protein
MAKRIRLNKRVAILLLMLGGVLVALVVAAGFHGGLFQWLENVAFPKDPALLGTRAKAAQQSGQMDQAARDYRKAIQAARKQDSALLHEYLLDYAKLLQEWARTGKDLTGTERGERFRSSIDMVQQALLRKPDYVEAQRFLCDTYWNLSRQGRSQNWQPVLVEVEKLLKLDANDSESHFRRGTAKSYLSQNMDGDAAREAISSYRKAIELKKGEIRYWMGLIGFLRSLEGRRAETGDAFQHAIQADPNSPQLRIAYASFLREDKKIAEAEKSLQEAIKQDPMMGRLALAEHYQKLNKMDDAIAVLAEARQLDKLDPRTYVEEAELHIRRRRNDQAGDLLREGLRTVSAALETQPAGVQRQTMVQSRFQISAMLADVLLDIVESGRGEREKLMAEVRTCHENIRMVGPGNPFDVKLAGRLLLLDGKLREAAEQLEKAYRSFGGMEMKTANLLINLYLRLGLPGKAEQILDVVLSVPGQRQNTTALLAKARLQIGYRAYDKAEAVVTQVLQLEPTNTEARNLQIQLGAIRGGGMVKLPGNLDLSGQTMGVLLDRAIALWVEGRRPEATAYAEQLLARAPEYVPTILRLSDMYRETQEPKKAEDLLTKALAKDPNNKALKKSLAILHETDRGKVQDLLLSSVDDLPPLERALEKSAICGTMGDQDGYLKWLDAAATIDPNSPAVTERLFRVALLRSDWRLAADCARRAGRTNLDGLEGKTFEARLAFQKKDFDGAIALALQVLQSHPNDKAMRVILGQSYLEKRFLDEAYDAFKAAEQDDPGYAPALIGLIAVTGIQGNKKAEYRDYVFRANRLTPGDPFVRESHLQLIRETSSPQELIAEREKAYRQNPNDLPNLLRLAQLYEQVSRLDKAEELLVGMHQRSGGKQLRGAAILGAFYARQGRVTDLVGVMDPVVAEWKDQVAALTAYGELLSGLDAGKAVAMLQKAVALEPKDPRGHLSLARLMGQRGEWRKAADAMGDYVRLRGQDAGAVKEMVRYLVEASEHATAVQHLDKLLAANPADAQAMTLKGVIAIRQNKVAEGKELLTRAIQTDATYAEPLVFRARASLLENDVNKARSDLEAAKRLSGSPEVAMELGRVYQSMRDYDQAELIYKDVRAEQRDYSPAIDQLVLIYSRRQKWKELEELLTEAKKLFPVNPRYLLAESSMWETREDPIRRLAALEGAAKVAPMAEEPAQLYLQALADKGDYAKVLAVAEPYLAKERLRAMAAAVCGRALVKLKRPDEADQMFLNAMKGLREGNMNVIVQEMSRTYGVDGAIAKMEKLAAGNGWRAMLMLGSLYGEAKKFPQAAETLEKAIAAAAPEGKYLGTRMLGPVHYQMRDFRKTEAAYIESLKMVPGDAQVLNNLAYLYTNDLDEPRKALPYAAEAAKRMPDNARILDTYGWTLARLGQLPEAEMHLARAIQLERPLAVSHFHLGWVYEQLKRYEESLKTYREGLEIVRGQPDEPLQKPFAEAIERVRAKLSSGSNP